ncbi:MAG: hypothetical protein ACJ8AO_16950, partial [Gemmatimonadaceae bacterium]
DRWAGAVARPRVRRRARASHERAARLHGRLAAHAMAVRWAWRVVGVRAVAEALLTAALPIGFCALVRANNPDLLPATRAALARLGAGLGAAFAAAAVAGPLLARRPPWPWARTLPWSSAERVVGDAAALLAPALLTVAGAVATYGFVALDAGLAVALCASSAGAAALRAGAHRQTGAVGETSVAGAGAAVVVALLPWAWLLAPVAALALGAVAVRRDRGSPDAVRWNELRHGVEGDVGWIART